MPFECRGPVCPQVMEEVCSAFTAMEALSSGSEGNFDKELLLVHLLHNLVSLGDMLCSGAKDNDLLHRLQGKTAEIHLCPGSCLRAGLHNLSNKSLSHVHAGRLSQAAGSMLKNDWSHCPASNGGKTTPGDKPGWGGRTAAMCSLLKYHIRYDDEPLQLVLKLVELMLMDPVPEHEFAGSTQHVFVIHARSVCRHVLTRAPCDRYI